MFCTQCGNAINETKAFCNVCGKKIVPRQSNTPTPGNSQDAGYEEYAEYDMTTPPPPPSKGLQKAAIIAVCVALFALGIGGGFLVMRGRQDTGASGGGAPVVDPGPSPSPSTPAPTPINAPSPTPDSENGDADDEEETPNESQVQDPIAQEDPPEEEEPYDDIPTEPVVGPSARFPFQGELSRYETNFPADVVFLQNTLNHVRHYYTSIRLIEAATGTFGGATRGAVADFQLRAGLTATGIVDEVTWYHLMHVFENPPAFRDAPFIPSINTGYVTLVNLHLRDTPSQDGESLGVKPEGTPVWVISYIPQDSWFFVSTMEGYSGYMKAEFLILEGILPMPTP